MRAWSPLNGFEIVVGIVKDVRDNIVCISHHLDIEWVSFKHVAPYTSDGKLFLELYHEL